MICNGSSFPWRNRLASSGDPPESDITKKFKKQGRFRELRLRSSKVVPWLCAKNAILIANNTVEIEQFGKSPSFLQGGSVNSKVDLWIKN